MNTTSTENKSLVEPFSNTPLASFPVHTGVGIHGLGMRRAHPEMWAL